MADPGFMSEIERLRGLAASVTPGDIEQGGLVGQKIAQAGHKDPRIMQALMALQGQRLVCEESDFRKAESHGDMQRREPVQLEQLQLVHNLTDPDDTKAKGNEYFKKGDFSAALAHYEKAVALLRQAEEVPAAAIATLLSNSALCLLKLKWPDRAKTSASQAIAILRQVEDTTFDQSKLFYRRALASEQLKEFDLAVNDMLRALQQAMKSDLPASEQQRLNGEVARLKKLKESASQVVERKSKEKENERTAEVQRMQGAELDVKKDKSSGGNANGKSAASDNAVYLTEQDWTHWTRKRISEVVVGVTQKIASGGNIEVKSFMDQSKVQAAITTKRGKRALYYEMDLHCTWEAKAKNGEMKGVFRLYNIGHDTSFKLGGDENTSYMYQLGWDQRLTGKWVEEVRVEAAELFDLLAAKVDAVIKELRAK